MPLTRSRRTINRDRWPGGNGLFIKGLCTFATVTQWTLRDGPAGKLQTCTAAKTGRNGPKIFLRERPWGRGSDRERGLEGETRPRGCAPKPRGAGATASRRHRGQRRASSPAPRRTAWPPPSRPALELRPQPTIPPIIRSSPPLSSRSPAPGRRAASQWEAEPSAQCAQPAPSRLRARKANPTRRGRRSGPTACRRAPPAAASSPRIGCTVPTRKSSSAARLRRVSAMTQEYDK